MIARLTGRLRLHMPADGWQQPVLAKGLDKHASPRRRAEGSGAARKARTSPKPCPPHPHMGTGASVMPSTDMTWPPAWATPAAGA